MLDSHWAEKLSRIAMKLHFLSVPNEFQKLLLQSYLTQRDLLYHIALAQFICLQYMVPIRMLWLRILFTPVSYQQLSLDTASHCSLYLHLGLILQPEAQGAPKIIISFPRSLSSACNQAAWKYTSYTGAILERTLSPTVSTKPAKHPYMAGECAPTCWAYGWQQMYCPRANCQYVLANGSQIWP